MKIGNHAAISLCAGFAGLSLAGFAPAQAPNENVHGSPSPIPAEQRVTTNASPTGVAHVSLFIIETHDEALSTDVPSGTPVPLDTPQKFKCKPLAGCTIIIAADVQVSTFSGGNNWDIESYVDGNPVTNAGHYLGRLNDPFIYATGNSRQFVTVGPGNHTLSTSIRMDTEGLLSQYQIDYEVTTP